MSALHWMSVLGVGLALGAAMLFVSRDIRKRLGAIESEIAALSRNHWNSELLLRGVPDGLLPPPPNGWAAGSDLLVELARIIRNDHPGLVVELGTGLSTLMIGLELKRRGVGKLIAVEHDANYASQALALVRSAALTDYVEVRLAPLTTSPPGRPWYDRSILEDLQGIDLLLVDGPPGTVAPRVRGTALPFFWSRLTVGGQVVLDDADRRDERADIAEWSVRGDCETRWLPVTKGCAVLRRTQ